jgi:hypothetical protein
MRENNFINESIRKASSLTRYSIRAKKTDCLYDDVADLMLHTQLDVSRLVDILLNNELVLTRYSDPTYPV